MRPPRSLRPSRPQPRAAAGLAAFALVWALRLAVLHAAQPPPPPVPPEREAPWRLVNFAPDAGVQRRMVFDVAFETNRVAWFAVSDGLYRYDGYHWDHFTAAQGLPSSFVRTVFVDRTGTLWVGTDRGAGTFDGRRFDRRGTDNRLGGPNVRRIVQTADGALWFCCDRWPNMTEHGGLTRFRDGEFRTYGLADGLRSDHVLNLFEESNGRLIALTGEGPAVRDGDRWSPLVDAGFPSSDHTWSIHEAADGQLFAEAYDTTLTRSEGRWRPCVESGVSRFSPLCVTRDGSVIRANHRAAGTVAFARWDGAAFVKASADLPDSGLELLVIRQAPDGAIWAVGRGTILRWEYLPGAWTWRPDLPKPILEDRSNRIWFSDSAGLVLLEGDQPRRLPGLHAPLAENRDGALWAGAESGVARWHDGGIQLYPESVCGLRELRGLHTDARGTVWIDGRRSDGADVLAFSSGAGWKVHGPDQLRDRRVTAAAVDPDTGLWVILGDEQSLTYDLAHITTNSFEIQSVAGDESVLPSPSLSVSRDHVHLYGYGGLWESRRGPELHFQRIQSDYGGVFSAGMNIGDTSAFLSQEGNDGFAAILVRRPDSWLRQRVRFGETLHLDRDGWLLVADGAEFVLWQARQWNSPTYVGLPTDTTITALLRSRSGEFWIGTPQGALHFAPDTQAPETFLDGHPIPAQDRLEGLRASGVQPFTPRSRPNRFSFAWRIDDAPWSGYGDWPEYGIPLPALHHGRHRLEVRARDGLGTEDPTPAFVSFDIVPVPIQDRAWFRPALAGLGIGFGTLCVALAGATRRLRRHAGHLEEEVEARTAQLVADLDQRERISRALRESESRLLANLENTPNVAVQWYDRAGRVVYWNRASESIYGWRSDEVLGKTLDTTILDAPTAAEFLRTLRDIEQTGQPRGPYEIPARRRDGSPCWVLATTFAIPLQQGESGFACMDVDITERKYTERAQQAIARISEGALSVPSLEDLFPFIHGVIGELMPATNFYVALLDAGGARLDFPYFRDQANPPPPARPLGRGLTEYVLRTGRPLLASAAHFQHLVQQGEVIPQSPPPVSWLGVPLRTEERAIGVLAIQSYSKSIHYGDRERELLSLIAYHVANAIDRKRAEQDNRRLQAQLVQAQKMESVGRLAGGVAHDFNNMLQTILGTVELAMEQAPPHSALHEDLREIRSAAERSADLTRQLLAFARKQTIRPRRLDLNETVGGMLKMLRRLIGENVHLAWIPGPDLWPVKVDPSQVDQILANLCVNARDAIDGTGRVTIETANVTLDSSGSRLHPEAVPGDYVLLAVGDDGRGMDAEVQKNLFEPFFTTKPPGEGTGLGLATVYGIVKQNGGLIEVESRSGHGSAFRIYLPRTSDTPPPSPTLDAAHRHHGTETILLVEDESQILSLGRRILEQHGYTVLAAPSPLAALTLAAQYPGPIHLLLTDVVMPGLNGRELRDRLRSVRPGLKCLYMSGYTADVIADHGILPEGIDFLAKPFGIQGLSEKIREILDRPGASHPAG